MLIYLDHAVEEIKAQCAREGRANVRSDLYDAIIIPVLTTPLTGQFETLMDRVR